MPVYRYPNFSVFARHAQISKTIPHSGENVFYGGLAFIQYQFNFSALVAHGVFYGCHTPAGGHAL
jgi:hypothetical protein